MTVLGWETINLIQKYSNISVDKFRPSVEIIFFLIVQIRGRDGVYLCWSFCLRTKNISGLPLSTALSLLLHAEIIWRRIAKMLCWCLTGGTAPFLIKANKLLWLWEMPLFPLKASKLVGSLSFSPFYLHLEIWSSSSQRSRWKKILLTATPGFFFFGGERVLLCLILN